MQEVSSGCVSCRYDHSAETGLVTAWRYVMRLRTGVAKEWQRTDLLKKYSRCSLNACEEFFNANICLQNCTDSQLR